MTAGYIQQAPVAEVKEGADLPVLVTVATIVPDLDARTLVLAMTDPKADINDSKCNNIVHSQNFDDSVVTVKKIFWCKSGKDLLPTTS